MLGGDHVFLTRGNPESSPFFVKSVPSKTAPKSSNLVSSNCGRCSLMFCKTYLSTVNQHGNGNTSSNWLCFYIYSVMLMLIPRVEGHGIPLKIPNDSKWWFSNYCKKEMMTCTSEARKSASSLQAISYPFQFPSPSIPLTCVFCLLLGSFLQAWSRCSKATAINQNVTLDEMRLAEGGG